MPNLIPAGMLALPLALFAGSVTILASAAPAAQAPDARVELELAGVVSVPEGTATILVLREKGAKTVLPLVVPDAHGLDARAGDHKPRERLLGRAIEALGGRVAEVVIEEAQETASAARVLVAQGSRRIELHGLPSESIALAVAAGVPIVTSRHVLDESGLTADDLARARGRGHGAGSTRL